MRLKRNAKCSPSCRQSPKYCGICTCIRFRAKGFLFQKTASSETVPTSIDQHSSTQPITHPNRVQIAVATLLLMTVLVLGLCACDLYVRKERKVLCPDGQRNRRFRGSSEFFEETTWLQICSTITRGCGLGESCRHKNPVHTRNR